MNFLISDRIKLVKFTDRFVTAQYLSWLNDQEVNKYLYVGRIPITKDEITNRNDSCNIMFAITTNIHNDAGKGSGSGEFDKYIGTISINGIDWINRKAEIGYMIGDKNYWSKGLATEAVKLASDYALKRLNLNKVEAGVVGGNIGSIRALEKNEFKQYCIIPEDHWVDGKYVDVHRFYKMQAW